MSQQYSKNRVSFRRTVNPLASIDELIAEPKNYAKISFLLPPEALPASLLLATQRSRARLSGMRHLWDGLRVRLDNHAAGAQADNPVIQPTRNFAAIKYSWVRELSAGSAMWATRRRGASLGSTMTWRLAERNPVDDGVIFWILAVVYDLAVKILSDTPAGDVLYGYRVGETFFAER